mmetsp:Transcript_1266/g.2479  ORF Transcript_1266/g.2479 Transcript_1266/m.2479 type:complete len:253 (+) Transcript_1266:244-1002(+)
MTTESPSSSRYVRRSLASGRRSERKVEDTEDITVLNPPTGIPVLLSLRGTDMRRITVSTPLVLSVTFTGATKSVSTSSTTLGTSCATIFFGASSASGARIGTTSTRVGGRLKRGVNSPEASTAATVTWIKCFPSSIIGTSRPMVAGTRSANDFFTTATRLELRSLTRRAKFLGASSHVRASAMITLNLPSTTWFAFRLGHLPPCTSTPQRTTAPCSARRGMGGLVTLTILAGMWKISTSPSLVHSATENWSQ